MIAFRAVVLVSFLLASAANAKTVELVEPPDIEHVEPPQPGVELSEPASDVETDASTSGPPPSSRQSALTGKPGRITGEVLYSGPEPTDRLRLPKKAEACGKELADERLLLGPAPDGESERPLRNAVVWIEREETKGTKTNAAKREPRMVEIDQRQCRFVPRVAALRAGDSVRFHNGDRTLHTVLLQQDGKMLWKRAMPIPGQRLHRQLTEPGRVFVRCDAGHHWAVAHLHVFPHEWFAVTEESGAFELPELPAGRHTLVVWHEQLGEQRRDIDVSESDGARVRFVFRAQAFAPEPD